MEHRCRLSTGPGGQGTGDHRDLNHQSIPANREGTKIAAGGLGGTGQAPPPDLAVFPRTGPSTHSAISF